MTVRAVAVASIAVVCAAALPVTATPSELSPPPSDDPRSEPDGLQPTLLDLPPTRARFSLDDRGSQPLPHPLLQNYRFAHLEQQSPFRVYMRGDWATWRYGSHGARLSLGWGMTAPSLARDAVVEAAPRRSPFRGWSSSLPPAPQLELLAKPDAAYLYARAVHPVWMSRLLADKSLGIAATTGLNPATDGFATVWQLPPVEPIVDWRCRRRPVLVVRYEGESERFDLVHCDERIAPEAVDRLSVLARPPDAVRPQLPLPDEPEPGPWAARHEWTDGVRLVHPRLLWALQKVADAYPGRGIYIFSGYRPPEPSKRDSALDGLDVQAGHQSLHATGRALDIKVHGVPSEDLFETCRELRDVGCGYYPNNAFVHLDVRPANRGRAFWIDASRPGQPSRYVDSWPGVVDGGAMAWVPVEQRVTPTEEDLR